LGLISRQAIHGLNLSVTVHDLVPGKRLEFKRIEEMAFVEDQLRGACEHLKAAITASANFGGEEMVELD
jgi:hypothetical protein